MSIFEGPNVVKSGLVLYLDASNTKSYPGSGTTWNDLSGNSNHATLYNSPTWSSTNKGQFAFSGSTQYCQLPSGFANFTSGMTSSFWANFDTATNYERIMDFGNGQSIDNIAIFRFGTTTQIGIFIVGINQYTSNTGLIASNTNFYTITYDNSNFKFYRNGVLDSTVASTTAIPNVTRNNNYLGKSNWTGDPYFAGSLSSFQLYNRALTASEIQQSFNASRGRFGV